MRERVCVCGDNEDDHGGDPAWPLDTACNCDGCDCIAFEHDPERDDAPGTRDGEGG